MAGWTGKWDSLPAAHVRSVAFDLLHPRPRARGLPLRGRAPPLRARVRLGGVSVHAVRPERERERLDLPAFLDLGVLARLVSGGARRAGALSGWRSSRRCSWRRSGSRIPTGGRRGASSRGSWPRRSRPSRSSCSSRARCTAARLLGPHGPLPGRPGAPWSLWDWGQYHARGLPNLHLLQRVLQGAARGRRAPRRLRAAPEVAASARRAHRCPARGLRALPDVLALHVHPWSSRLRRSRCSRRLPSCVQATGWTRRRPAGARSRSPGRRLSSRRRHPRSERRPPPARSDRHACPHPADRELGPHADHRVVGSRHPGVGDRGCSAGQHACVVRLHVRVRTDYRGDASVEPRAIATFSLVASAWKSSTTTGALLARVVDECIDNLPRRMRRIEVEQARKIQHRNLDAVARLDDGEAAARRPRAGIRRTDHASRSREVVADAVAAIRVVAERDHVGACGEQLVRELRRDAGAVGDVLAVYDAEVRAELVAQTGKASFDRAPAGDAEDVGEEEESRFRTSVAAGRSSIESGCPRRSCSARAPAVRPSRDPRQHRCATHH